MSKEPNKIISISIKSKHKLIREATSIKNKEGNTISITRYEPRNFKSIDIANALHKLAKDFENDKYISNLEMRVDISQSLSEPATEMEIIYVYREEESE